jgi:hypothetical protein
MIRRMSSRNISHMHQAQQVHIAPQGSQQRRNPTALRQSALLVIEVVSPGGPWISKLLIPGRRTKRKKRRISPFVYILCTRNHLPPTSTMRAYVTQARFFCRDRTQFAGN